MCVIVKYEGMVLGHSIKTLIIQMLSGGLIYVLMTFIYMIIKKDSDIISILNKIKKRSDVHE